MIASADRTKGTHCPASQHKEAAVIDSVVERVVCYLEALTTPAVPAAPLTSKAVMAFTSSPVVAACTNRQAVVRTDNPVSDGHVLRLLQEAAGKDLSVFADGRMLVWDIARHDGYNIPAYPMAGCGDIKEFLADEGAHDVPDWYRVHLGMDSGTYKDIYKYELVMVRNRLRFRRVWVVPAATMADAKGHGGPLASAMLEWARFALGTVTDKEDPRLFKR